MGLLIKFANDDGFVTETYISHTGTEHQHEDTYSDTFDFSEVLEFQSIVDALGNSKFFRNFKKKFLYTLQTLRKVETDCDDNQALDIVCYGLGNFMSCIRAKHQFAFLIILKNILSPRTVSIFDPVFTTQEKCILEDFGLHVLNVNERGKRNISNRTIFFMPHCHCSLYNNLLSANWNKECLSKLMIIGNGMKERYLEKRRYTAYASKFATEIKIRTDFESVQVFYSLSLICFHIDALGAVPLRVWNDTAEPIRCNYKKRKTVNLCDSCEMFRDE